MVFKGILHAVSISFFFLFFLLLNHVARDSPEKGKWVNPIGVPA